MKTIREINKIKATLLYVLNKTGELDFIKLFKVLYFAQQYSLVKMGRPLVNETFYALKLGPVPSFSYKSFQSALGRVEMTPDIQDFLTGFAVRHDGHIGFVKALDKPDMDWISPVDLRYLDMSIERNIDIPSGQLSEKSHDEAWVHAFKRAKRDPEKNIMTKLDIAKSGGASLEMLDYIKEKDLIKSAIEL